MWFLMHDTEGRLGSVNVASMVRESGAFFEEMTYISLFFVYRTKASACKPLTERKVYKPVYCEEVSIN